MLLRRTAVSGLIEASRMVESESATISVRIAAGQARVEEVALAVNRLEDDREDHADEGDPDHRLVKIGHRRTARDDDAAGETVNLEAESDKHQGPSRDIASLLHPKRGEQQHEQRDEIDDPRPEERIQHHVVVLELQRCRRRDKIAARRARRASTTSRRLRVELCRCRRLI